MVVVLLFLVARVPGAEVLSSVSMEILVACVDCWLRVMWEDGSDNDDDDGGGDDVGVWENIAFSNCAAMEDFCDNSCGARKLEICACDEESGPGLFRETLFFASGCEATCVPVKNAIRSASPTSLINSAFNSVASSVLVTWWYVSLSRT